MKSRLLSVRQAAAFLGVSIRTVRRCIADGRLKVVTVRSLRMIPFGKRLYGLKPQATHHMQMRVAQVDLGKIVFEGLPDKRRKCTCLKDRKGRFALAPWGETTS